MWHQNAHYHHRSAIMLLGILIGMAPAIMVVSANPVAALPVLEKAENHVSELSKIVVDLKNFRQELKRCAVLSEIVALGAFQMSHVWLATLRTPEAKKRLIDCKELKVKDLRCVVIDPSSTEVRLRLHWVPYHVTDDAVSKFLEPYGKFVEVARQQDEAPPSGEPCSHPVGADGSTEVSPVKDKKEVAGGFPEPDSAAPPPTTTPTQKTVAPREASPPTFEKAPSEGHDTMDETTESTKRGLDENPPSTPGTTPRPNPWMERTKKGRFQPTPTLTPDDRRRLNSK
ncbi:uncharacterized protein ISCGN_023922 [Ixodes scapularis]